MIYYNYRYGFHGDSFAGYNNIFVVLSGQDSSMLLAWMANHSLGFGSSCPFMELETRYSKRCSFTLTIAFFEVMCVIFMDK